MDRVLIDILHNVWCQICEGGTAVRSEELGRREVGGLPVTPLVETPNSVGDWVAQPDCAHRVLQSAAHGCLRDVDYSRPASPSALVWCGWIRVGLHQNAHAIPHVGDMANESNAAGLGQA